MVPEIWAGQYRGGKKKEKKKKKKKKKSEHLQSHIASPTGIANEEPQQDLERKPCTRKLSTPKGNKGKKGPRADRRRRNHKERVRAKRNSSRTREGILKSRKRDTIKTQWKINPNHGQKERERNGMEYVFRAKGPALGPARPFSV